ncbi:MAG: efflux RND transporter permease subunit, partial [Bryobacterales bacterium]|nr:efflux RND transporter permease subunit [Bryobacterales bacterium]
MNGPVAWCARNGVVGNLLLFVIVAAGGLSIAGLNSTLFPDVTLDVVTVSVPYRGASPPDVEESVCVLVEEALQGIEGVNKITSTADEGIGVAVVEVRSGYDVDEIREEIKSKVDGIEAFPEDAGRPVVRSIPLRVEVIGVVIYGAADLPTLKRIGEQARRDLEALPEISQVEMANVPPYEISIEVSEQAMRRWGLTFDDVAAAVRRSSVDLPGGSVKTPGGEIMLRTSGRADT